MHLCTFAHNYISYAITYVKEIVGVYMNFHTQTCETLLTLLIVIHAYTPLIHMHSHTTQKHTQACTHTNICKEFFGEKNTTLASLSAGICKMLLQKNHNGWISSQYTIRPDQRSGCAGWMIRDNRKEHRRRDKNKYSQALEWWIASNFGSFALPKIIAWRTM